MDLLERQKFSMNALLLISLRRAQTIIRAIYLRKKTELTVPDK